MQYKNDFEDGRIFTLEILLFFIAIKKYCSIDILNFLLLCLAATNNSEAIESDEIIDLYSQPSRESATTRQG